MKKWAVLVVVAALAAGGGVAWALANRGSDQSPSTPTLAERIDAIRDDPSPESDLILDRCYELSPLFDGTGALNPELEAFPARLLDSEFELTAMRFGRLCYEPSSPLMLETEWKHRKTGATLMLDQLATESLPTRIAPLYATFSDNGYDFYLMNLSMYGYPKPVVDGTTAHRIVELAVEQLRPPVPLSCFYRSVSKDWSDLAALGIGDPRSAIPAGFDSIQLDFTALEQPAAGCPATTPPPSAEPDIQFQAMFGGDGNRLLGVFARSLTPDDVDATSTFGPGEARWQSAQYQFSLNWHPEQLSDDQVRAIARTLDPGFQAVCALSAREVDFTELQATGIREPVRPGGLPTIVSGSFYLVGHSPACANPGAGGFQAHWLMEYRDRGALVDVTVLRGEQMPNMRPLVFEDKTLYWKRADGVAFYLSGVKAEFSREELLAIARSVDPAFDESLITAPPPP